VFVRPFNTVGLPGSQTALLSQAARRLAFRQALLAGQNPMRAAAIAKARQKGKAYGYGLSDAVVVPTFNPTLTFPEPPTLTMPGTIPGPPINSFTVAAPPYIPGVTAPAAASPSATASNLQSFLAQTSPLGVPNVVLAAGAGILLLLGLMKGRR
jgi:hypothetical protein